MDTINTIIKGVIFATGILVLNALSTSAHAGLIVTEWSYSTDATFSNAVFGAGTGTTIATDYELSWGAAPPPAPPAPYYTNTTSGRSALTVGSGDTGSDRYGGGPVVGSVDTMFGPGMPSGSEIGLGVSFTHWNNSMSTDFATLLSARVTDTLTLTPVLPAAGPAIPAPTLLFDFEFRETLNAGPCAGGTPTPCGDLFGFSGTPTLNLPLFYDGNHYLVDVLILGPGLTPSPIGFLNDGQCAALGFNTGPSGMRCQGFLTPEAAHTTVQFGFSIRAVPEPGTILIMAIGLLFLVSRQVAVRN